MTVDSAQRAVCEGYRCRRTDTTLFIVYGPGSRERVMHLCPRCEAGYGNKVDR